MNVNRALVFVAAAALVVGAVVWFATRPDESSPASTKGAPAGATKHAPRTQRAAAPPPAETAPPEPPPTETPVAAPTPAVATPRAILRFQIDGIDSAIPAADAHVEVVRAGDDGRPQEGSPTCSSNGGAAATFDVDVSPLLPDGARGMRMNVSLDRDGYLPFSGAAWLYLSSGRAAKPTEIVNVPVRLRPAGWAKGIVQDERFARVANAVVGAFVKDGAFWRRIEETRADARGEFRIRMLPGAANLVVVAADGLAPTSVTSTGVARTETTLTPFTLPPGLAIAGTVRGGDGHGLEGASVAATPIWAKPEFHVGTQWLAYPGGQAIECPAVAGVDGGLFKVSGLVPGDYDMTVAAPGFARDLLATVRRRAAPPLESLAFVVEGATLVVEPSENGRPIPRLRFAVVNDSAEKEWSGTGVETDGKGVARLVVQANATYRMEFETKAYEPERRTVIAPALGEEKRVEVALRRRLERPKLMLVLRPEDASGDDAVTAADVRLFSTDGPAKKDPDVAELVTFARGTGSATIPWAGGFRVVVLPRGGGYRMSASAGVVLKDGEATRVEPRFARGGRVRFVVHDPAGNPMIATYRVLAENGDELASGTTNAAEDPLLPPGRTRIEITPPGGVARPVEALVKAEETTRLDLEFEAPSKDR